MKFYLMLLLLSAGVSMHAGKMEDAKNKLLSDGKRLLNDCYVYRKGKTLDKKTCLLRSYHFILNTMDSLPYIK